MQYGNPVAAACVRGDSNYPGVHGKVKFIPQCGGVLVVADICGLPESDTNFFALHIHENGYCSGAGFPNTGNHYNPGNRPHPNHAGDLLPLLSCRGKAFAAVLTNRFRVEEIIGRSVVIHSHPDDFKTQPSGGAGTKIACGIICKA